MKKLLLTTVILAFLSSAWAQESKLPAVNLTDLNGQLIPSSRAIPKGSATLVLFWKSSDNKSLSALQNLQNECGKELEKDGVKIITIYSDHDGSWNRAKAIVDGNVLDFKTYIDVNGDFQRSMNVGDAPCGLLFDKEQNLLSRYNCDYLANEDFISKNIRSYVDPSETAYHKAIGR